MEDTTTIEAEDIYLPNKDEPSIHSLLAVVCGPVFSTEELQARELLGMPKIVCLPCKRKVVAAYELHEACIEADRKLWDMISVQKELQDLQEISTDLEKEGNCEEPGDLSSKDAGEHYKRHDAVKIAKRKSGKFDASGRTCELCWTVTKFPKRLYEHMRKFHPDQILPCTECNAAFFSPTKLEEHKLFHVTGQKYTCNICKKRFKSASGVRNHIRGHGNTQYQCDLCDKKCTNPSTLKTHRQWHNSERAFPCERCPSRFKTKGSLKQHMTVHTKERNYSCDLCGSKFTKSTSLIKHVLIHTGCNTLPSRYYV